MTFERDVIDQLIEDIDLQRLERWQVQRLIEACTNELTRRNDLAKDGRYRGLELAEARRRARLAGKTYPPRKKRRA